MHICINMRHSLIWTASKLLLMMLAFHLSLTTSIGQSLPKGFSRVTIATGLNRPTAMAIAPDGRIFYAEQDGKLRVIKNNVLLEAPFLNLVVRSEGERGLVGLVLDPQFSSNGYIYVYYTVAEGDARNRISRFTAKGDVALAGSEKIILELDKLSSATNHNGGAMRFGLDGMLYVAVGENANKLEAQNLNSYFGKILRILPDGGIPKDNPFKNGTPQRKRVWAYGLRNPFTFDIQPGTGRMFVNDVGWNSWEEINDATLGARNFGWPYSEGPTLFWRNPIYAYPHGLGDGKGCGITGGVFFSSTSTSYPAKYKDKYFFIDLCNSWINTLDLTSGAVREPFATNIGDQSVALTLGPDGNLYYLSRVDDYSYSPKSALYKIVYSEEKAPSITAQPLDQSVSEGDAATFTVAASGDGLRYQWRKNGNNLAGAMAITYTLPRSQLSDAGKYSVVISNSIGSVISGDATLAVTERNTAPTAKIISPNSTITYRAGDILKLSGEGTDPEDGKLPPSAFTWMVVFHHDTHTHPGPSVAPGTKDATFTVPNTGEDATSVWYRLVLTVQDSRGKMHSNYVDIRPQLANLTVATDPIGLKLQIAGNEFIAPFSRQIVAGMENSLDVVSPQVLNGVTYEFVGWREGQRMTSEKFFTVFPMQDTRYIAVFKPVQVLRSPDNPKDAVAGLNHAYYKGESWKKLPDFNSITPENIGVSANFDLLSKYNGSSFGATLAGYINVPRDGKYIFYSLSDDGSKVFIGDILVVDNDGAHGPLEQSGGIGLKAGLHAIRVHYFNSEGDNILQIKVSGPGISKQFIPSNRLYRVVPTEPLPIACTASGSILREVWTWIAGRTVAEIPVQRNPNFTELLTSFESQSTMRDYYGALIRGYVCAPISGKYTFWIAGDDNVELWLSTDKDPAKKQRIAFVYGVTSKIGYTAPREWNKYETQQSAPITLVGGQQYYIEALHKEASREDHVSVGWDLPNGAQERPILGGRLSPFEVGNAKARLQLDRGEEVLAVNGSVLVAYPNPFSNQLTIQFFAEDTRQAKLEIYDIRGVLVNKLFDATTQKGDKYSFEVEGNTLKNGLYIIRLTTSDKVLYKKVELIR